MKISLSGFTREERLTLAERSGVSSLVVDFCLVKKFSEEQLEELRRNFSWLMLSYDLKSSWSRLKSRPDALSKLDAKVEEYIAWADQHHEFFDVLSLPDVEEVCSTRWKKFLKTINWMITVPVERLGEFISDFRVVGVTTDLPIQHLRDKIRPLIPSLTAYSCKLHVWDRVDKETALSGLFWSSSSSNWLTSTRYGVTFEYVGNLKLVTTHSSKGKGKAIRTKLKSKCLDLGLDHDALMLDDNETVLLWTLSQWDRFAKDSDKISGYWDQKKEIAVMPKRELATPTSSVGYLRTCNTCFLSAQCPAFEEDADCKISSTPKVDTPEDIQNLLNLVIQVQSDRVLFGAFAEKVQNAGINPEVSKELETLTKLMKDAKEIVSPVGGDEVLIKAKGSGVISRLFGGYGRSGGGTKPSTAETIIDVSPVGENEE